MEDREEYYRKKRQEETEQIKRLDPDLIAKDLGLPLKWQGTYYLGRATWRGDKNPSLSIQQNSSGHWLWHDFGTGKGGSWIDLYMEARNMSYIEARNYLLERFFGIQINKNQPQPRPREEEQISTTKGSIEEKKEVWKLIGIEEGDISEYTKAYLKKYRQIDHIPSWLREIKYVMMNATTGEIKEIKAFGIQDTNGNWHVRYAIPHAKVKERVITLSKEGSTYAIIKKQDKNEKAVVVEGFVDAIRADEIWQDADIIILNTVENWKKVANVIQRYKTTYIATDTDEVGQRTAKELSKHCNQAIRVKFQAKDLDEAIKNHEKIAYEKINQTKQNRGIIL